MLVREFPAGGSWEKESFSFNLSQGSLWGLPVPGVYCGGSGLVGSFVIPRLICSCENIPFLWILVVPPTSGSQSA